MPSSVALWLCLALVILLRGIFALVPSMGAWGLNVQRFLDPITGWGLWAAAALTLVPAIARRSTTAIIEPAGRFLARSPRAYVTAFVAGALFVFLMPDRVWFVGDFLIRLGNVESGRLAANYVAALPLDRILHGTLLQAFGQGSATAATLALRTLGAVEAGLLAALAVHLARVLDLEGTLAAVASGLIFFGGTLTLFTGLGKPASEMCLAVLALGAFGLGALRGRYGLLPASLVVAVALWLHRSSVMLLPAWAVVAVLGFRGRPRDRRAARWLALLVPFGSAAFALPRILGIAWTYDLSHHLRTAEVAREGGVLAAAFAPRHLADLTNLILALSPAAATLLVLLPRAVRSRDRRVGHAVPLVLWASFLPALALVQPQQGVFRDWDVFGPAGLAFSMLTVSLVVEMLRETKARRWLAAPLLALAMVSSFQWLVLNRNTDAGLDRVHTYLTQPPGPGTTDRPLVWDFLTSRYIRLGRWPEAADAAAHAAELAPHRRILLMWGIAETMKGDDRAAAQAYRQLLSLAPDDPLGWLGLAGAAYRLNDQAEFERAMERLRRYGPTSREAQEIRRHLAHFPPVWPLPSGPW